MSEFRLHSDIPASLWHNNPSLVHLLGISPLLAVSDSSIKALALGLALAVVCCCSAITLVALRSHVQSRFAYLWYAVVLAAFTSLVVLILQLFFYSLYRELGVYCYLIGCNLALLVKMEGYRRSNDYLVVAKDSLKLGLSLLLALLLFAALREILLTGSLFQGWELLIPGEVVEADSKLDSRNSLFRFAALQPAAFILLGLLLATLRKFGKLDLAPPQHRTSTEVERARVTGRLKKST